MSAKTSEITDFLDLLQSLPLRRLSSLSIFENFNQRYTHAYLQMDCSDIRAPNPDISQMLSGTSINFEHLSASFMVDVSDFLDVEEYQSPQSGQI